MESYITQEEIQLAHERNNQVFVQIPHEKIDEFTNDQNIKLPSKVTRIAIK